MAPDLLPLAESVADGSVIDWAAAEATATSEQQAVIRQLRVVADLARLHRSLPGGPTDTTVDAIGRRPPAAPAIGTWGHLALLDRLGGGSFGDVYRAWDPQLEREVALKLLRVGEATDDPLTSRITTEARLLARVRHPHVVTVHGVAVQDGRVGLWMDLIRGATLEQLLAKNGPFSAREAALVGIDLCQALAAIHGAGLIHRDVKAQNVMREDGGHIVLMDLGTGRAIDPSRRRLLPDLAGTPLYLAPEIFQGAPASERTDLYSLGVLLYHLVTGAFPVRATTIEELQAAHAQGTAVRLRDARADLPTAFVRVVDRAIAADPERRYASAGALEADLADALADTTAVTAVVPVAQKRGSIGTWRRAGMAAAIVAALLALAALGWPALRALRSPATGSPGPIRSIAVLPLVNLSGDPAQDYFVDGMTDEIIAMLGHLDGLNVISRTSIMQFKGTRKPLPQIAQALHVDAVLEGAVLVLTAGDPDGSGRLTRVRINARLIHAGTDSQLWNKTFERVVADVMELQSEVATAVTEGIDLRLTSPEQGTGSKTHRETIKASLWTTRKVIPKSYDAYLRGRYLWNKRTPEDLRKALGQFKTAVDIDPTSALAWSGLADGYSLLANYDDQPPRQVQPLAKAAAARAVALDDTLAEAHATLAELAWTYDWDFATADREFERAIALNPNYATAHQWRGLHLNWVGRFDEALTEMERAEKIDPLSPIIQINVARCHFYAHRYDKAISILEQIGRREPDFWVLHALLGQVYFAQSRFAEAIRELVRARDLSPSSPRNLGVLGDIYARSGRRADALRLLSQLTVMSRKRYVPQVYPAMVYMGLGDKGKALDLLEQAYADRSDWIPQLRVEPEFDPLRNESRFQAILRRAAQTPEQGRER